MVKRVTQGLWVAVLTVVLLGVPRFAGWVADGFDVSTLDPDGAFAWISIHHMVQAVVFLLAMVAITRLSGLRFGFALGDRRVGMFYVRLFAMIYLGYTLVSMVIILASGSFLGFPYPVTARSAVGQLLFQLLLSGPSEELIFRAFAITMLGLVIKERFVGGKMTAANVIAAVIFGLAHVRFSFAPFSLTYHPFQVVYAIVLGLAYGVCYERSNSMLYPMIMHSLTNVVAVAVSIVAAVLLN